MAEDAFDPDAYLGVTEPDDVFDPDAFLSEGVDDALAVGVDLAPKGFFDRIEDRLTERQAEGADTGGALARGEITAPEAALQVAGKAAGFGLDIIGETLVEGYDTFVSDENQEMIGEGIDYIFNDTAIGRKAASALNSGIEEWGEFKEENPRAAKNIESIANIGLLFAPVKGNPKAGPSVLKKAARKLEHAAARQTRQKSRSFLTELIRKDDIGEVFRTTQKGVLRKDVYNPTKFELSVMKELNKVKGVSKNKGFQGNFNAAIGEIEREAGKLSKSLSTKADRRIANVANERIKFAVNDLKNSHLAFTGPEAHVIADRMATNAQTLIAKHGSSPSGLLKARQELDKLVKSQVSESKAFGEGTWAVANKSVRDMLNQTIDDFSHNVAVRSSLSKQSKLYTALDRLAPKAFKANSNVISRIFQDVGKVVGVRGKVLSEAALVLGTTTLGASQIISGPLAAVLATGYTGYKAGQLLGSASAKKGLSLLLKATDKAILTSKNPSMIKSLRADRAAVVEMLKAHKDAGEKELQNRKNPNLNKFLERQEEKQPQDAQISVPITDTEGNRGTVSGVSGNQFRSDIQSRQKALLELRKALG